MTKLEHDVLIFLHNRWSIDCKWTNGNCYYFALILAHRFNLQIYYNPCEGHFVAGDGEEFFDFNGVYRNVFNLIPLEEIKLIEPNWYARLMRDCRD